MAPETRKPNIDIAALRTIAHRHEGLHLLVLFGSRARCESTNGSDWDFAFLAHGPLDPSALWLDLSTHIGTARIDLVDLSRANGLLRFRVARDGFLVFERQHGEFRKFQYIAASFWCDAQPVLRRAYDEVLEGMG